MGSDQELLSYPTANTFRRIIALTNRSRSLAENGLPRDSRLELYSGIDLRGSLEEVLGGMKGKIPSLSEVTHMYYCAYSNAMLFTETILSARNIAMTYNAVHATDRLCSDLKFVVLQTGSNYYGVAVFEHLDKFQINPPLKEDNPRVPAPYGDEVFYYAQTRGHGPLPGSHKSFVYTHTDTSQDIMTKAEIYLSVVKPAEANGEAFNIADTAAPGPWSVKWPMLAEYFGLKGTAPIVDGWGGIDQWWKEHQEDYQKMCETYGLQRRAVSESAWVFSKVSLTMLNRNRELSLDKIRSIGFTEELSVGQGHYVALDRMVDERILPPRSVLAGSHT